MIKVRVKRPHSNAYGDQHQKAVNDTYDVPPGHELSLIAAKLVVLDTGKPLAAAKVPTATKPKAAPNTVAAKKAATAPAQAASGADVVQG